MEPRVPGYRIEYELGRGGMAVVYLAYQESLQRPVALKVMSPNLASDEEFTRRFLKEGPTLARLIHPGIVKVFDTGVHQNDYYLAMEYIPGGTLKQRIQQGLRPGEAIVLVRQIAEALGYAHRKGLIHRDIKGQNVLLRPNGEPVLTDFGIAKALGNSTYHTTSGVSIGSPHYMSPEQIQGQAVDQRTDLYALGVVLHEMLTGILPYTADNSVAIAYQHVTAPLPRLPARLRVFQSLIDKTMAKRPEDRFANAAALIQALDDIEAAYLASANATTVQVKTTQHAGINWLTGVAAVTLVALAGAGGYYYVNHQARVTAQRAEHQQLALAAGQQDQKAHPDQAQPSASTVHGDHRGSSPFEPQATVATADYAAPTSQPAPAAEVSVDVPSASLAQVPAVPESPPITTQAPAPEPTVTTVSKTPATLAAVAPGTVPAVQAVPPARQTPARQTPAVAGDTPANGPTPPATAAKPSQPPTPVSSPSPAPPPASGTSASTALASEPASKGTPPVPAEVVIPRPEPAATPGSLQLATAEPHPEAAGTPTVSGIQAKIARLQAQAEQQLKDWKLTSPDADNAYDTYRQLARLPGGKSIAEQGFQRIAALYLQLARDKRQAGQLDLSQDYIERGLGIRPHDANLLALRKAIRLSQAQRNASSDVMPPVKQPYKPQAPAVYQASPPPAQYSTRRFGSF